MDCILVENQTMNLKPIVPLGTICKLTCLSHTVPKGTGKLEVLEMFVFLPTYSP